MKMSAIIEDWDFDLLRAYSRICAWSLARAHARSGDAAMIAGYMGSSETFEAPSASLQPSMPTRISAITGRSSGRSERNGSRRLSKPRSGVRAAASCAILLLASCVMAPAVFAQNQAPSTSALSEQEKLEREFTDPLTTLPQVVVRDSYTPANYGPCTPQVLCFRNLETNQVLVRPLIPRIPPESLLPFSQLIRPTFAVVTVQSSRGGTRTEFGDLPVFDVAVLPWPDRQKTGLLIGVGPTFVFPTATSKSAGEGAWQAGPALGAIYSGIPGLLVGFIAQNPVSFAYTNPHRPPQNTFELQPVFALHLWDKWYLRSAEANWTMGWRRHYSTMLPLSIGLGRTIVRPGLLPMSIFVTGQWMAYRQFAPIAPQTSINFGVAIAFPQIENFFR
jgi:Uncharacterized protein conserved in bacteria (DUF2252)